MTKKTILDRIAAAGSAVKAADWPKALAMTVLGCLRNGETITADALIARLENPDNMMSDVAPEASAEAIKRLRQASAEAMQRSGRPDEHD